MNGCTLPVDEVVSVIYRDLCLSLESSGSLSTIQVKGVISNIVVGIISTFIDNRLHPLIPNRNKVNVSDLILILVEVVNVSFSDLANLLDGTLIIDRVLDTVVEIVPEQSWDLYTLVNSHHVWILTNCGDFRILEWEHDHVVNGKYR